MVEAADEAIRLLDYNAPASVSRQTK
jgi:hypothetical protein